MKSVLILGSTGSIGTQALDVCQRLGFSVCGLSSFSNVELLLKQIKEFNTNAVAVSDKEKADKILSEFPNIRVFWGTNALEELVVETEFDLLLNAVSGFAGLSPTIAAINKGRTVALANKEALVSAGSTIMTLAKEKNVPIIPVDSEHSAIFQCIGGDLERTDEIKRLIITASGGPFYGRSFEELKNISPEEATAHPVWKMGKKISVDSATLMNKGLEFIEAVRLFSISPENVSVAVHPGSTVHSLVEFIDGAIIAQMGVPDMRLPIQYALTWPKRYPSPVKPLNLTAASPLHFYEPDTKNFKALPLAIEAIKVGGTAPTVLNAANEVAVKAFIEKKILFTSIPDIVEDALDSLTFETDSLENVFDADRKTRSFVAEKWRI